MRIVADTHVHLYPFHDLAAAFAAAFRNLPAAPGDARLLCLTERHDCHAFRQLRAREIRLARGDFRVDLLPDDPAALRITGPDGATLCLLAGRQIISRERVEVLALTADVDVADGLPLAELLPRLREAGAAPVLSWAPGKWFFGRGRLVQAVFEAAAPGEVAAGDTSLRPLGWLEPLRLRLAARRGLTLLAGSDPLPLPGEEAVVGCYASVFDAPFDPARPAASLRDLLRAGAPAARAGRRGSPPAVLARLFANAAAKHSPPAPASPA